MLTPGISTGEFLESLVRGNKASLLLAQDKPRLPVVH